MSSSSSNIVVQYVMPVLGACLSIWMSLSPFPALRLAEKAGTLGAFNPIPVSFFMVNALCWVIYAVLIQNPYIFTSNSICVLTTLNMSFRLFPLATHKVRKRVLLLIEVGLVYDLILFCLEIALGGSAKGINIVINIAAMSCLVYNILLYITPLTTILEVIREKDSSSVNAAYNLTQLLNALFWGIYGFDAKLPAIYVPNIIGTLVSCILFVLIFLFPAKKQKLLSKKGKTSMNQDLLSQDYGEGSDHNIYEPQEGITLRTIGETKHNTKVTGDRERNTYSLMEERSTTTVALDAFMDRTVDGIERGFSLFEPIVVSHKPHDLLEREYSRITNYKSQNTHLSKGAIQDNDAQITSL